MPKFRKKPVVIEAVQWEGSAISWDELQAMEGFNDVVEPGEMGTYSFYIKTLEGKMKAEKGDWVIKGIKNEFYPCKPDVFEATYESAE